MMTDAVQGAGEGEQLLAWGGRLYRLVEGEQLFAWGGRVYRLVVGAPTCVSIKHWHLETHADGSGGTEPHHHHTPVCGDLPRQATLYPAWSVIPRHAHDFSPEDHRCGCGAVRQVTARPAARPGRVFATYSMPADSDHPAGWSYTRKEDEND